MKISTEAKYKVYGDLKFRGKCPSEDSVHVAFIAWVRHKYPDKAALLLHPKNEGKRTPQQVSMDRKMGSITKGASDIIIVGGKTFVCELKRQDCTKSHWQPGQEDFLNSSHNDGAFACVCFGLDAAKEAFLEWVN